MTTFRKLERLPNLNDLHYWADYVELRCIDSPDRLVSRRQLVSDLRRGRDVGEGTEAGTQGEDILDEETVDRLLGVLPGDFESDQTTEINWEDFVPGPETDT